MRRIFDIETYKNPKADAYYAKKEYKAPSNYKDPVKIENYLVEEREKDSKKAGLTWWTGMAVCIGISDLNHETRAFTVAEPTFEAERSILIDFFRYLDTMPMVELIGKSSKDFDYPFLIGRAMAHDLGIPIPLRSYEKTPIYDVDHIFSFSRSCGQVSSLANYAWGLGISGKLGTGAGVADWVEQGKFQEIEDYCVDDLRITAEMFKRYNKLFTGGSI